MGETTIFKQTLRPLRTAFRTLQIIPLDFKFANFVEKNLRMPKVANVLRRLSNYCHAAIIINALIKITMERYKLTKQTVYKDEDTLSRIMDYLGYIMLIVIHIAINIESTWKSKVHEQILGNLNEIHLRLNALGYALDAPKKTKSSSRFLYALHVFYVILTIVLVIFWYLQAKSVLRMSYSAFSDMILKTKMLEMHIFGMFLTTLLEEVLKLGETCAQLLRKNNLEASPKIHESLQLLYHLQDLHGDLWHLIKRIEYYFEWCMPGLLLKTFLDLTLLAYWTYLSFESSHVGYMKIYCVCMMSVQILDLYLLCRSGSRLQLLSKRLARVFLHIRKNRGNLIVRVALRQFWLQQMHESMRFSAGDFAYVDMKTLGKFLLSVAMYMVILIQFRMSF